jgi:lipoprotein NlpI
VFLQFQQRCGRVRGSPITYKAEDGEAIVAAIREASQNSALTLLLAKLDNRVARGQRAAIFEIGRCATTYAENAMRRFLKRFFGLGRAEPDGSAGPAFAKPGAVPHRMPPSPSPSTEKPVMPAFARAIAYRRTEYPSVVECDKAIREISEAPAWVRMDSPAAYHNRGLAYFQKREFTRAIEDFTEAIRCCREAGATYHPLRQRGVSYLYTGRYREAIADFTQVLALEPGDVFVYGCRGAAFNEVGQYDNAIADSGEAIRRDPAFLAAYINRGFSYLRKGDYKGAADDYSEAIRLDPGNGGLYEDRAQAYRAAGDADRALRDERRAQELRQ